MSNTVLSSDPTSDDFSGQALVVDTTPSLSNLSVWAYLSLSFIILATTTITIYALYSCYHSARRNAYLSQKYQYKNPRFGNFTDSIHGLGGFSRSGSYTGTPSKQGFPTSKSSPFRNVSPFKKEWFKSESQISLAPSEPSHPHDTEDHDSIILNQPPIVRPVSFGSNTHNVPYIEPKALPTPPQPVALTPLSAPSVPLPPYTVNTSPTPSSQPSSRLDVHNIRFVPPQSDNNKDTSSVSSRIWTDPKLSPVMGPPAVPPGLGGTDSSKTAPPATGTSGAASNAVKITTHPVPTPKSVPGPTPLAVAASPLPSTHSAEFAKTTNSIGNANAERSGGMGTSNSSSGDVGVGVGRGSGSMSAPSSPSSRTEKKQQRRGKAPPLPKTPSKASLQAEKF
ncbi:hypothetical protein AX16_002921 [Volvariella volvacea WC 439]|nr:hypothetical protein AX16_002921 [Volvariella volvacea WC 439]